jgi:hypothetical protein
MQNGLKEGEALTPLLFDFTPECAIRKTGKPGRTIIKWNTSAFGLC